MQSDPPPVQGGAAQEQLALQVAARPRTRRSVPAESAAAEHNPVATVVVETALAHLDRPFEYLVPAEFAESAQPGVRVKVRFAGQDLSGFVLQRRATAEHQGRLSFLRTVVSDEPVLTPGLLQLCQSVARWYGGTLADVVRLAVPPRHARAEKALARQPADRPPPGSAAAAQDSDLQAWQHYPAGPALVRRILHGQAPAASWLARPGPPGPLSWDTAIGELVAATLAAGRGVLVVVPDARDIAVLDPVLRQLLGPGEHVVLSAAQGPQARYTAWLKALRGHVRCVLGTRAAAFAPILDLGLMLCWDDGDDSYVEPRAPGPHTRQILRLRAEQEQAALVFGGFTRSVAVQASIADGSVRAVQSRRRRDAAPRVVVPGDERDRERHGAAARARLPAAAWQVATRALQSGPVLVQVPRRGYLPAVSCQHCRRPARCAHCQGPLAITESGRAPQCRWCARSPTVFRCPQCEGSELRSGVIGARRTAEELGRGFPGVAVHQSDGDHPLQTVRDAPALVVATPGSEPVAPAGYHACLLLDAWGLLERPSLDATAEALRRWCNAAALTRGASQDGVVVLCGAPHDAPVPAVEALVRWAPEWFAEREWAERCELGQPPSSWMAVLRAEPEVLQASLDWLELPETVQIWGPLAVPQPRESTVHQVILRAPWNQAQPLTRRIHDLRAWRSARRDSGVLQIRIDPDPSVL